MKNKEKLITAKNKHKIDENRLSEFITRKDIEKSYNIDSTDGTEAYYSNRYGWTLRKTIV